MYVELGKKFNITPEAHEGKFQIKFCLKSQDQEEYREKLEGFELPEAKDMNIEVNVSRIVIEDEENETEIKKNLVEIVPKSGDRNTFTSMLQEGILADIANNFNTGLK
jgi:hypothetical protein